MRTKTLTARNLKPGMVVHARGIANALDLTPLRQVAEVSTHIAFYSTLMRVTFTDGTTTYVGAHREFTVTRGKTARRTAKARAAIIPSLALANALGLLGAYATA